MSFFNGVMETFRDNTRDNICARLRSLGIDAQMAERGRAEENIVWTILSESLGLIDIAEGPIRWVIVRGGSGPDKGKTHYIDYGVPDPRLGPNIPSLEIKSVRKKSFPVFGQVIDLRWKGKDSDLGIIDRLNSDISIKHPIMESRNVRIRACVYGNHRCWIITVETREVPSRELWNCYQAIAEHLLAEWSPA